MNIAALRLEISTLLARAAPALRIAKKAAEHMPGRDDTVLGIAVKALAIIDIIRESDNADSGYWRKLRDERSLVERDSETFVALFFGTALRDAYTMKRKVVSDRVDVLEADLGAGQSIIFREERWADRPRMADEFLLSPTATMSGVIDQLWAAYPSGIYVSVEVNEYGYDRRTTVAEVTVPPHDYLTSSARALLKATIDTQYQVAHAEQHRTYLLYGDPGTGKTSFAVGLAHGCGGRVLQFDATALPLIGVKELGFLIGMLKPSALILNDMDRAPLEKIGPRILYLFETLKQKHPDVPLIITVNDPSKIDPALLRPRRIEKPIKFTLPDGIERTEIVTALAARYHLELDAATAEEIISGTEGLSHAYVAHMMEAMQHELPSVVLADMQALRALAASVKGTETKSNSPPV